MRIAPAIEEAARRSLKPQADDFVRRRVRDSRGVSYDQDGLAGRSSMPPFVIGRRVTGTPEPASYYQVDGLGRVMRVGDPSDATKWESKAEALDALQDLGLSSDPEVFVEDIG